jgi:hypothetical protein
MRRPVANLEHCGSPSYIHTDRFPGKRLLKDALPKITGEEKSVGPIAPDGRQKTELRNADVLGFVHHYEIEGRRRSVGV